MVQKIEGRVSKGLGGSSKWMPAHIPWLYPGTLNIILDEPRPKINWYNEIETSYNKPAKLAKCKINSVDAIIVKPPLTKLKNNTYLIEIAHQKNLRLLLGLCDNDTVIIEFF